MKTEAEIFESLGGRMIVETVQKEAPALWDFAVKVLCKPLGQDSDLEGYLQVKEVLSLACIDPHPHSCAGHVIVKLTMQIADKFPATAAALAGQYKEAFAYSILPVTWPTDIVKTYLKNGLSSDFEVLSISDMLKERQSSSYLDDYKSVIHMLKLQAVAYGAVDKVPFENETVRAKAKSDLEAAFVELNKHARISHLESAADYYMYREYKPEEKDSVHQRISELLIDPMSIQFEKVCSSRFQWGDSYDTALSWINSKLERHASDYWSKHPDKAIRIFTDPKVLAKSVIDTLNLSQDVWVEVINGSKEKKREKLGSMVRQTQRLIEGLGHLKADPDEVRKALTNYAVPILQEANRMKADHGSIVDDLLKTLIPAVNFKDLHGALKPGARKLLVAYVATHNPEYVHDLKLDERGAVLDNALGL